MLPTQSFFQSLDEWIDYMGVDENQSCDDCPHSECTGDCSFSCIPDFLEGSYLNSENYMLRL